MKEYAGKILIIVQNLPVPLDRRVWLESRTLTDNGYRVSVISPKSKEYSNSCEMIDGVAIYRYAIPFDAESKLGYFMEFVYAWLMTAFLSARVLFREGFDVIQACNPPDTYFLLGLFYKLLGKKFVFDHHDLSPEMFVAKFSHRGHWLHKGLLKLERLTYATARVVITTNDSYREVALRRGRKHTANVFVVRTGPDMRNLVLRAPDLSLKEGRRYLVCYLGEMCPQDGVDYLLRAIHHLVHHYRRQDTLFTLVGGGPHVPKLKELCTAMGLDKYVRFAGRLPDQDVCRYLSTADVCVDPDPWSEWADQSTMNKILEYMAFARPIVSFDLKEARNTAQRASLYAKPNDVCMFAEKVNFLLNNPALRKEMGDFGRRRVITQLSWEHSVPNLLAAYDRVFKREVIRTIADTVSLPAGAELELNRVSLEM
jgi:glycosyltransferase involved in cell wall biosynthesis